MAGQPSDAALDVIHGLAAGASRIIIATDADLGGVRIAQRLVTAIAPHAHVEVLDVGTANHVPGARFGSLSIQGLTTLAATDGNHISAFAHACLSRGYRVEQEACIRAALSSALSR